MHITQLEVANVKRLSAVTVTPDGNMVIVGGENDQGKSSLLDSIMYAVGGGKELPEVPLKRGEKAGHVELKLSGDDKYPPMIVRRVFTDNGKTRLEVKHDDPTGAKVPHPQALLDSFQGRISFDPLAFTRLKPGEQQEQLKSLAGLDFTDQDAERKRLYEVRTGVNRESKSLKSRWKSATHHPDAPAEEVAVADVMAELEDAQATNKAKHEAITRARHAEQEAAKIAADDQSMIDAVADLERKLEAARGELEAHVESGKEADRLAAELLDESAAMQEVDCDPIRERINSADKTNAEVRENAKRAELTEQHAAQEVESKRLTQLIDDIDDAKQEAMAAAQWPVEGLGFSDTGVTFDGLPLEQGSQSQQIRVSVAMGFAANPRLRVMLVREASLLGKEAMQLLAELGDEYGGQVWAERVGDADNCTVVIEDGRVREKTQTEKGNE